jgi:tetratricopeptide (TPR) repeat protein
MMSQMIKKLFTRTQWLILISGLFLLMILLFTCETKSSLIKTSEKMRQTSLETTGIQNLIADARNTLKPEQAITLENINKNLNKEEEDSIRMILLKELSSKWYEYGYPAIAGYYAEEVARIANEEEAWSIAGTTYVIALSQSDSEKLRKFAFSRAIKAFENAISINPDNVSHRLNLAICYTEFPPEDNPMRGILMLRELNEKYPENIGVINNLARLAIKTNQYDRAIQRLEEALSLDPENITANCLMVDVLSAIGELNNISIYKDKCVRK